MINKFQPATLTNASVRLVLQQLIEYVRNLVKYQEPITLTDAATVSWNVTTSYNAKVTLAGSRTLAVNNMSAGDYYTLEVIQGGSGSYTLTLPAGTKVSNGGAGVATLSTAVGSIDILTFYYNGTTLYCNVALDFT